MTEGQEPHHDLWPNGGRDKKTRPPAQPRAGTLEAGLTSCVRLTQSILNCMILRAVVPRLKARIWEVSRLVSATRTVAGRVPPARPAARDDRSARTSAYQISWSFQQRAVWTLHWPDESGIR